MVLSKRERVIRTLELDDEPKGVVLLIKFFEKQTNIKKNKR